MALAYSQLTESGKRSRRRRTLERWRDPFWRLQNLYWIVDENGQAVRFTLRSVIERFLRSERHWRNIILKARQLGWTTAIAIFFLDSCLFTPNLRAGIVAHKLEAAQVIFRDKILYAYDHLPETLKRRITATKRDGGELLLSNNSGIRVDTSMRSGTLNLIHVSEYGAMCAHYPDKAREVKTGTLEAAHDEAMIFIESTAEGSTGDFFEMCDTAQRHTGPLSRQDYKFHFFPWYLSPEYVLDPRFVVFSDKDDAYFAAVEHEAGVTLTPEQRAWYVKKHDVLGYDMLREYPSLPREAFQASTFSIFDPVVLDWMQARCKPPVAKCTFREVGSRGTWGRGEVRAEPSDRALSVWKVWAWPKVNHHYIVYGDVMEGILSDPDQPQKGHDCHFAGVLDRNMEELVATYHSQQDTIPYGQQLLLAARFFRNAWASPEVNSVGLAVLNEFKRVSYPFIYSRESGPEQSLDTVSDNLGLKIGAMNRKPYLEALRTVLRDRQLYIYDEEVIAELRAFVNKDGRWEAATGANDDAVMMLAGLVHLHQECPMGRTTIEQRDTTDRPGQKSPRQYAMAAAGGIDEFEDDEIDDEEQT